MKLINNLNEKLARLKDRASLEYEIFKMHWRVSKASGFSLLAAGAAGAAAMTTTPTMHAGTVIEQVVESEPQEKPEGAMLKQTLNGKTITGYVVDEHNNPWNNQIVRLFDGENLLGTDTLKNGYFTLEDIITSIRDKGGELPKTFTLKQNYPNPFNPHTTIQYTNNKTQRITLKIYDLLGREVKTLLDDIVGIGTHEITWNATINDGAPITSGIYFYRLTTSDAAETKKMNYVKGISQTNAGGNTHARLQKTTSTNTATTSNYKLIINGEDALTTTIENIDLSGPSPINLGTLIANSKPTLTGFIYDLDTKYDENNNRQTPTGISGLRIALGSDTTQKTTTNSQGRFILKADKTGTDSVFVYDDAGIFYNWKNPKIELQPGEKKVTAFNDTTGIPLFKRMYDTEVQTDFLDWLIYILDVNDTWLDDPSWKNTLPRVRDEDLPIKVYMNRNIAPTSWYADSAWIGLKAAETGRFRLTEVADKDTALLIMRYDYEFSGQGTNIQTSFDVSGPHISHWEIRIRGPPGDIPFQPQYVAPVSAHEVLHLAFGVGRHSPYMQDMFYGNVEGKVDWGYYLDFSTRERKAIKLFWNLERNPKLLNYFK